MLLQGWFGRLVLFNVMMAGLLIGLRARAAPSIAPAERALRRAFPEQAAAVLEAPGRFVVSAAGFRAQGSRGAGAGPEVQLPARGEEALRLRLAGGLEVRVREEGARGPGALVGRAVAYARAGGTSFWAATGEGVEEWLLLEPFAVRRGEAVAAWKVEGAEVRQAGEAVELADARGATQLRVTAPSAYGRGGRPIGTRLVARAGRIELSVEASGEAVLVDPGWKRAMAMQTKREGHTATLLLDQRVLVAGGSDGVRSASAELYDPRTDTWRPAAAMSTARSIHTATLLDDGCVLVVGGSDGGSSAEVYDPRTDTWAPTLAMHSEREFHTATLLKGGRGVLVTGGRGSQGPLASAEVYDRKTNTWTSVIESMHTARASHTATLLDDGRVLLVGGYGPAGNELASAEVYDPDPTKTIWTSAHGMAIGRASHTATQLSDGSVLVTGGQAPGGSSLASVEVYHPKDDFWSPLVDMRMTRALHTATRLSDGRVLVFGGMSGAELLDSAEVFDPETFAWTIVGKMAEPRARPTATALADGRVLATGGEVDMIYDASTASAEIYDPSTDSWTLTGAVQGGVTTYGAVAVAGDRALVSGGFSETGALVADAQVYDAGTNAWIKTGDMNVARTSYTATRLLDGRVLVAGGLGSDLNAFLDSAELYDPVPGVWTPTAKMTEPRNGHTAALMEDGRVLVIGGGASAGATAEVYDPKKRQWTPTAPMAARFGDWLSLPATALKDGRVLVSGAGLQSEPLSDPATAQLYDPKRDTWQGAANMRTSRWGHAASRLSNGWVLVSGGFHKPSEVLNSAEIYHPETNEWFNVAPMTSPRVGHIATTLSNGTVLVVGGSANGDSTLASAEVYDPETNQWTMMPPLPRASSLMVATSLPDGRVLVLSGGFDIPNAPMRAEIFRLQPAGNECNTSSECAIYACIDGTCCDSACDGAESCSVCSRRKGAVADGICTPMANCTPYRCDSSVETLACKRSCNTAHDCAPGFACDLSGNCVSPPPLNSRLDATDCSLADPEGAPRRARFEPALLLLAALATRRRRRRHT